MWSRRRKLYNGSGTGSTNNRRQGCTPIPRLITKLNRQLKGWATYFLRLPEQGLPENQLAPRLSAGESLEAPSQPAPLPTSGRDDVLRPSPTAWFTVPERTDWVTEMTIPASSSVRFLLGERRSMPFRISPKLSTLVKRIRGCRFNPAFYSCVGRSGTSAEFGKNIGVQLEVVAQRSTGRPKS